MHDFLLLMWSRVGAGVPGVKPVIVELTDFKTKEKVDELEVDAVLVATGRAPYTQVSHSRHTFPLLTQEEYLANSMEC